MPVIDPDDLWVALMGVIRARQDMGSVADHRARYGMPEIILNPNCGFVRRQRIKLADSEPAERHGVEIEPKRFLEIRDSSISIEIVFDGRRDRDEFIPGAVEPGEDFQCIGLRREVCEVFRFEGEFGDEAVCFIPVDIEQRADSTRGVDPHAPIEAEPFLFRPILERESEVQDRVIDIREDIFGHQSSLLIAKLISQPP